MIDSLGDLLPRDKYQEPPEVRTIKNFVKEKYNYTPEVTIQTNQILIGVNNAALAGALRFDLHEIKKEIDSKKRLTIRIQ